MLKPDVKYVISGEAVTDRISPECNYVCNPAIFEL